MDGGICAMGYRVDVPIMKDTQTTRLKTYKITAGLWHLSCLQYAHVSCLLLKKGKAAHICKSKS